MRHNTHTHTHTHTHTQRERVSERERNTHMRSHKLRQREREGGKKGGDRQTDRDCARQNASISDTKIPDSSNRPNRLCHDNAHKDLTLQSKHQFKHLLTLKPSPLRHCARTRPPSLANSSSVSHCPYVHQQVPPVYLQKGTKLLPLPQQRPARGIGPGGRGGQSRQGDERRSFVSC